MTPEELADVDRQIAIIKTHYQRRCEHLTARIAELTGARPVSQGTEDSPEHPVSYLSQRAVEITATLHAAGFEPSVQRQVLGLAEEVGEFVGAYRRWSGQARRSGTKKDMHLELADVVITAYVAAVEMGFDLDAAINDKLAIVFSRGWREEAS